MRPASIDARDVVEEIMTRGHYPPADTVRAPIDLPVLVRDTIALHPDASRDEIELAVINGVETRTGRALNEWYRGRVGYEVAIAFNQLEQQADGMAVIS